MKHLFFIIYLLIMTYSCNMNNRQEGVIEKRDYKELHRLFRDSILDKVSENNVQINAMMEKSVTHLIKDERHPLFCDTTDGPFSISYVIYDNTTIVESYFLGSTVDVLITKGNNIFAKFSLTRDSFYSVFYPSDRDDMHKYDIHKIVDIIITDNCIIMDIMLTIPDSDIDYYFRITCKGDGYLYLKDVSEEYWERYWDEEDFS